jgi:DeoR/GlpR family transcriptional regulator of sugar metabolism
MGKLDDREEKLLEELRVRKQVEIRDITQQFNISESTARRMCAEMERKELAVRTFGGLRILVREEAEYKHYSYEDAEGKGSTAKARIGKYATEQLKDGDIIFLSGGTTVRQMAIAMTERIRQGDLKDVMIVTNSIVWAEILSDYASVILTGGKVRSARRDVAGYLSEQTVRNARFDKCFVGVDGIDLSEGLIAFDMDTANLDRLVLEQSDNIYILADSSKFKQTYVTAYEKVLPKHVVITDDGIDPSLLEVAKRMGISIQTVG